MTRRPLQILGEFGVGKPERRRERMHIVALTALILCCSRGLWHLTAEPFMKRLE